MLQVLFSCGLESSTRVEGKEDSLRMAEPIGSRLLPCLVTPSLI